jgi:hypothetical protein
MSDEVERGNASVPVQYHQFDISDEDGPTGPDLERGHTDWHGSLTASPLSGPASTPATSTPPSPP